MLTAGQPGIVVSLLPVSLMDIFSLSIPRPMTGCKIPGVSNLTDLGIDIKSYKCADLQSTFYTIVPVYVFTFL